MKKLTLIALAAAMTFSNVSHAITEAQGWYLFTSTGVTLSPTMSLQTTSGLAADRKIIIERIANDALLNIETGEKTALLNAVIADLKAKHTELANVDDKTISKRLVQEAINFKINDIK
ncbi:hypothetical protein ACLWBD_05170 [Bdellovibrio sp. HCB117]|uniref:hypothetical protein n=1 Tax=Bdellovibrio sp. HCB117 TaxID=3394359 RepID=UPI0039B638C2